ncbi:type I restriction enzyme, S subunit [Micromonospora purpureochromogenes]|uniref:Type I restriction enzyme, S subunit n=1 Tax=Micromonospora purpureochromogenes TaxID=47872 RepID=A0A1C4YEW9_9ACTN|nr:restriction endonuclease subunit S [Micromonospora purpureochromogenes]SCF19272.1 type I restriction enzyme, S subunit [Micromonospora purpureochromogenes]
MTSDHVVPLRRLFRVVNGGTPTPAQANWNGSVPWATPVDLGASAGAISQTQRTLTQLGARTGSRVVPAGSLILSTRAPIGYIAIAQREMAFNQGCRALVATSPVDIRYFYYQLSAATKELQSLGQGSTFQELSSEVLASHLVHAPDLEDQRRIADFLESEVGRIDRLAKVQQEMLLRLNERDLAILDSKIEELFGAFGAAPFRRYIASVEQGSSPQCDNMPAEVGEWGVLKVSSVKRGAFHPSENKKLPNEMAPAIRYEVREGDLLVTRANTPALVGAAAVVGRVRRKLMLCDKIFRIRTTSGLDKSFLAMVARGTRIRDLCAAASHGTSQSMANLKIEEIKEWPIPAAPLAAQRLMLSEVSAHHGATADLGAAVRRQLGLLRERRHALIRAAVSGQIDLTTGRGVDL